MSRITLLHVIFVLYLFQGVLYGLQVKFLPVFLRKRGSSLTFIGSLNLLALPWFVKTLWAPLIDLHWTRTTWLRVSFAGISTSLVLLHWTQQSTVTFAVVIIALNVFSASKELVIGKILLSELDTQQLKTASSINVLAYKSGSLVGGGCALWISSNLGITNQVFLIAAVLFLLVFLSAEFFLPKHCNSKPEVPQSRDQTLKPEVVPVRRSASVLYEIYRSISRGSKWLVTCLLVYKYASHSSHMLFTMALVDQGVGVSRIGLISGVVGQTVSLGVAILVGVVLSNNRISALRILYVVSILDALSIMGQLWFVLRHETTPYLAVFLLFLLQHVVLGAQTTPVFCLILTYSQQQHSTHQATQHSFYTTLETMGSTLSLFLAGLLAEYLGYTSGLCISLIVAVAFVVVVGHGTEKLEHRKKEE